MREMKDFQFSDISETLLIPLYARSIESKSNNPILIDKKAIEITDQLNTIFSNREVNFIKISLEENFEESLM